MPLIVKQTPYSTFVVLTVQGKVDPQNVRELEEATRAALTGARVSLIFDFSGLEFIISSGMGMLLVAKNLAAERGGEVLLAGVRPDVYRVFDLLDFPIFFRFFPHVDVAVKELLQWSSK
ncbi:MAG: STAS domain-containing protein [Cyanobacteria bacterium NC_groundwater_1444_Ag_S-0.65um_54_12]|nr:STAS domain-containing protein [Cyanobacteria bacterium NC_groundwater_1444_Ag_S-0.65um_54_12]